MNVSSDVDTLLRKSDLAAIQTFLQIANFPGYFYVSSDGDDENPGTLAKPFLTTAAALDAAEDWSTSEPNFVPTVVFLPGSYSATLNTNFYSINFFGVDIANTALTLTINPTSVETFRINSNHGVRLIIEANAANGTNGNDGNEDTQPIAGGNGVDGSRFIFFNAFIQTLNARGGNGGNGGAGYGPQNGASGGNAGSGNMIYFFNCICQSFDITSGTAGNPGAGGLEGGSTGTAGNAGATGAAYGANSSYFNSNGANVNDNLISLSFNYTLL
jgi:hypothetical protein